MTQDVTPEMITKAEGVAKVIVTLFENVISRVLGPDYRFVVVIGKPNEARPCNAIFSDVDTEQEMQTMLNAALSAKDDPEMMKGESDTKRGDSNANT